MIRGNESWLLVFSTIQLTCSDQEDQLNQLIHISPSANWPSRWDALVMSPSLDGWGAHTQCMYPHVLNERNELQCSSITKLLLPWHQTACGPNDFFITSSPAMKNSVFMSIWSRKMNAWNISSQTLDLHFEGLRRANKLQNAWKQLHRQCRAFYVQKGSTS